ncbi:MAG: hypothetical protein CMA21_01395 [Euryarchaeota archaeon]|nr:hypothetical protein [Euryarchaeota archaeon]|tara:strand:- start:391 stop:1140 length:750 start_codon:yes stop_codon:yes gene_type:complete
MSSKVEIRSLNDEGIREYAKLNWGPAGSDGDPPSHLLYDDEYSHPHTFPDGMTRLIEPDPEFSTQLDVAELIDVSLGPNVSPGSLKLERGLWSWLSLLFYDKLRKGSPGNWKNSARPRFIPSGESISYFRHTVWAPYNVLGVHGKENGAVYLSDEPDNWQDVNEQILSVSGIISSPTVVAAANDLYLDHETGKKKVRAGGDYPGSASRFRTVWWQLRQTYDLRAMTKDEILEILPSEFDHFNPLRGSLV